MAWEENSCICLHMQLIAIILFNMGATPNKQRGTKPDAAPYSFSVKAKSKKKGKSQKGLERLRRA